MDFKNTCYIIYMMYMHFINVLNVIVLCVINASLEHDLRFDLRRDFDL